MRGAEVSRQDLNFSLLLLSLFTEKLNAFKEKLSESVRCYLHLDDSLHLAPLYDVWLIAPHWSVSLSKHL